MKTQLAVVLVFVVLCNIPEFARYRVAHDNTRDNGTSHESRIEIKRIGSFHLYDIALSLVFIGCLPLLILILLTIRLIKATKARRRMHADIQSLRSKQDRDLTFALVIVVIVFIICRVPALALYVDSTIWCQQLPLYYTLIALNSTSNFVIYIIINKQFRDVLFKNICRRDTGTEIAIVNMVATPGRVEGEPSDHMDRVETAPSDHMDRVEGEPSDHMDRDEGEPSDHVDRVEGEPSDHMDRVEGEPSDYMDRVEGEPSDHMDTRI